MTNFKDQFKALRDDLTLTSEERTAMRSVLAALSLEESVVAPRPVPSPFVVFFASWQRAAVAFLAVILVGVGGTGVAAEGALPGDTLYGIKVGLNEKLERAVALGTVAKAEVDVSHAEERIREVELLSVMGADRRNVEDITLAVDAHIERASEAARTLSREGDTAAADLLASHIESTLSAHADILEAQAENEDEGERRKLRALSVALSITADEQVPEEDRTAARTAEYYERMVAARKAQAEKSINALSDKLSDTDLPEESLAELSLEYTSLQTELEAAHILLTEGNLKDAEEAYDVLGERAYRAFALYSAAKRVADETDKEVVVSFSPELSEDAAVSEAAVMMTAVTEDVPLMKAKNTEYDGPALRFFIRERGD